MIKSKRKLTILTGATSGIGLALAKKLQPKHDLILIGRKPQDEISGKLFGNFVYIQSDITDVGATNQAISAALEAQRISHIDHLIHCAGTGVYKSPFNETEQDVDISISVNLLFPIMLTRKLYSYLEKGLEAQAGNVTFIGSVAHRGAPNMATYAATKAGLNGFARSLRAEWRDRIPVQIIHPGPTLTPMLQKAGYNIGWERTLFLSPETMAAEIARLIETDKASATVFLWAKLRSLLKIRRRS